MKQKNWMIECKVFSMIFLPAIDLRALWREPHESAVSFHKSLSQSTELLVWSRDTSTRSSESSESHGLLAVNHKLHFMFRDITVNSLKQSC